MQRDRRLRRPADFTAVYRRGRSVGNDLLVLRSLHSTLRSADSWRAGIVAGKKVGGAVVRNRVKRRIRAALATEMVPPGWDIVVIARPAAATARFTALQLGLTALLRRARLLPPAATGQAPTQAQKRQR